MNPYTASFQAPPACVLSKRRGLHAPHARRHQPATWPVPGAGLQAATQQQLLRPSFLEGDDHRDDHTDDDQQDDQDAALALACLLLVLLGLCACTLG